MRIFTAMAVLACATIISAEEKRGWTVLLGSDGYEKHWDTTGNWKNEKDGSVSLTPRKGERGWSRFGAYLWSKKKYTDFEIEFDYKVQKRGNSGFYFHVGDKKSPVAKGIEVQIYDSYGKKGRLTDHDSGGIIPGIPPTANTATAPGTWNHFHIVCLGNDLTVKLNGKVVNKIKLDHAKLKTRPKTGYIGFQDHALPLGLRKIRIRDLSK